MPTTIRSIDREMAQVEMLDDYLPETVNCGNWITAYTLHELRERRDASFVLPICSLTTPYRQLAELGDLVLPPLFHEALTDDLKTALVSRIRSCFPSYTEDQSDRLRIVELSPSELPDCQPVDVLAFSVDTAVEEHGPHLPLGTDTIQSYSVLRELQSEDPRVDLARPLEYGQLTWGLPFGFSIDVTADLLKDYLIGYANALTRWRRPHSMYVVDVHGSITHRNAIVEALRASLAQRWTFRWLHEPLAEFASARGDQHAGGVETALVGRVSERLLDSRWWPDQIDKIAEKQMSFQHAVDLTPSLDRFIDVVRDAGFNGVIGDITNFHRLDANDLFQRMLAIARSDVEALHQGQATHTAGQDLW